MKKKTSKDQPTPAAIVDQPTVAASVDQPTKIDISKIRVEINGKTYDLCFTIAELGKAETLYRRQGHNISLMFSLPQFTLEAIREVFPCAVHCHHPELTWDQAQELVTLQSIHTIAIAVAGALGAEMA